MFNLRRFFAILLYTILAGCSSTFELEKQSKIEATVSDTSTVFPYHPLIYNLDLAILAYQLHGQSLIWPHDPYFEELSNRNKDRASMIAKVQKWAKEKGLEQSKVAQLDAYRGPGSLNDFQNNQSHDPIIYNYSLIDPWNNAIMNGAGTWTEYLTPSLVTGQIKQAQVCYRPPGQSNSASISNVIKRRHDNVSGTANDYLLAFEGGTGDKGEANQPASQSIMGFILTRENPDGTYDVHISFRGSRSGSAARAVLEAISEKNAKGNPDWITDLGYDRIGADSGGAFVSTIGKVHRGFAQSLKSIMPNLINCLIKVPTLKEGSAPNNIYVTGHSLGGALAQQFVSSILVGNRFGPDGNGSRMPDSLRGWPWTNIKLVTFGAPRVGDAEFAKSLTVNKLQSEFFSTLVSPADPKAIKVSDSQIVPRLKDSNRPVAFRVLNSKDPITTQKGAGGKHVGKTVYINPKKITNVVSGPDFSAHEQRQIRDFILAGLPGSKAPRLAIRYVDMLTINPTRNDENKGTLEEVRKLVDAVKRYYDINNTWFDSDAFEKNALLREQIRVSNYAQ